MESHAIIAVLIERKQMKQQYFMASELIERYGFPPACRVYDKALQSYLINFPHIEKKISYHDTNLYLFKESAHLKTAVEVYMKIRYLP
jgi:hypothetical protein